ncbi:hypothetical protein KY290_013898 [Solanum tuberosum]|uniref:GH3 middle domain-containing protein n=1 Tax=Solanum tuberosum TaxID=4113 RepID=A0ABQ7VN22_SOLTU|nr:hypothetical protein KY289_015561 [Solanum tuberosum]KAH0717283.1 hypothetical protein KY285_013314 [Solanum tuberosum]KAH0769917.1 hypothetical protein KY290_013898 [Solanum tuberosum]
MVANSSGLENNQPGKLNARAAKKRPAISNISNHTTVSARNTEVPDAMEMIFQSALALGRKGVCDQNILHFLAMATHFLDNPTIRHLNMLTSFVTGTGEVFPKQNTLNYAFFFFFPPLPVLFSTVSVYPNPLNTLSLYIICSNTSAGERKLMPTTQDESGRKNQNLEGIITRIWPNTNNLDVIVTGLTTPSRGPSQRGSGKKYELVITTYAGICRYRVGDILQVMGFNNSAPQFKLQSTLVMPTQKPFQDIMLFTANYLLRTQPMLFGYGRMFELGLSTVPSCRQLNWST